MKPFDDPPNLGRTPIWTFNAIFLDFKDQWPLIRWEGRAGARPSQRVHKK